MLQDHIKTADASAEKHVPYISIENCPSCNGVCVTVTVGKETIHPSTKEHSIKAITLYGITNDDKTEQLSFTQLGDENTMPKIIAAVKAGKYKKFIATSYCNLHGLWEGSLEI